jgi:predicted SnoaL-like aldol condensation-catalyzing enzyme
VSGRESNASTIILIILTYNIDIVRSSVDGDLVYLHVHSANDPKDLGQAVADIFRVRDGEIVEHWDVIQSVPEEAANKNTMF